MINQDMFQRTRALQVTEMPLQNHQLLFLYVCELGLQEATRRKHFLQKLDKIFTNLKYLD